jgi:mono/diheme cytochrome c family protein
MRVAQAGSRETGWATVAIASAMATAFASPALGDARRGLEYARVHCAACHAVEAGNRRSIRPEAPAFSVIAASPGMSAPALSALLQTSHRRMPDILLPPADRVDVMEYILGLKPQ